MTAIRASFLRTLSEDDLPLGLMLIAFAAFACVIPAQADTFYHLRSGQEMWQSGSLLTREPFSWTFHGRPLANHWWLTQLASYFLYSLGGPLLLTVVAGALALSALVLSWRLVVGGAETRLIALLTYALLLPEWSVRPQVVSLLFTVLALRFVMADRSASLLLLLILWANMHAVVVLGIAIACVPAIDALIWNRSRFVRTASVAVAAFATPLVTPFGFRYWTSMIATVQGSRSLDLQEYRSAFNLDALTVLYWIVAVALVGGIVRHRRTLRELDRPTRLLVLAAIVLLPTAVTSVRNIPFFVLAAIPAVTRLVVLPATERRSRVASRTAWGMLATGLAAAVIFVVVRWDHGGQRLGWQPLTSDARLAIQSCSDRMYNGLYEGGQLIWFVPSKRVFIDGRVEAYPLDFMSRVRTTDLEGDYRQLFTDFDIGCAVTSPQSVLFSRLHQDAAMRLAFNDEHWAVFVR